MPRSSNDLTPEALSAVLEYMRQPFFRDVAIGRLVPQELTWRDFAYPPHPWQYKWLIWDKEGEVEVWFHRWDGRVRIKAPHNGKTIFEFRYGTWIFEAMEERRKAQGT